MKFLFSALAFYYDFFFYIFTSKPFRLDLIFFPNSNDLNVKTINFCEVFSPFPAGITYRDGPLSGEAFAKEVLIPALKNSENDLIIIDMRGILGISAGWISKAYGELENCGLSREQIFYKLQTISDHSYEDVLIEEAILGNLSFDKGEDK